VSLTTPEPTSQVWRASYVCFFCGRGEDIIAHVPPELGKPTVSEACALRMRRAFAHTQQCKGGPKAMRVLALQKLSHDYFHEPKPGEPVEEWDGST
jgi:hypothetical protein